MIETIAPIFMEEIQKYLLPATCSEDSPTGADVAEEYFRLLQHSWFDSIDGGDLVSASEVLHEHAEIKHYRVWTGDQNQAEPFELISGKSNILLWLQQQRTLNCLRQEALGEDGSCG